MYPMSGVKLSQYNKGNQYYMSCGKLTASKKINVKHSVHTVNNETKTLCRKQELRNDNLQVALNIKSKGMNSKWKAIIIGKPLTTRKNIDKRSKVDKLVLKNSGSELPNLNNITIKTTKSIQTVVGVNTVNNTKIRQSKIDENSFRPKDDKLTLCFWNGQAVSEKTQVINSFRLENDIDIYLLAETWLTDSNHMKAITELKGNTCNFINYPRPYSGRGGGLGCIYKKQLSIERTLPPLSFTSMQVLELTLSIYSKKYTIVVIYRSEPAHNHWYTMSTFFEEFTQLLSHYNMMKHEVILTGDFNIHVNDEKNQNAKKFINIYLKLST